MNQKCLIWVFLADILKSFCHIWNYQCCRGLAAKFNAKIKILKLGTKYVWFGYFWAGIWKQYCHNWNQRPRICFIAKFGAEIKIRKFENSKEGLKSICYLGSKNQKIYLTLINNWRFDVTYCFTYYSLSLVDNSLFILIGISKFTSSKCLFSS